ncbi:MAG: hypothetical protein K8S55_07375 [Phycisphaerae bacterium]|nr:hypothetical protein [Phycisphaerae bacterium]
MAGAQVGPKVKFAEVFVTSPTGLPGVREHYLTKHLLCNETAFLEEDGYWRTEFLFDAAGDNRVDADFLVLDDKRLLVRATATNTSREDATWTITFLSAVNANCPHATTGCEAIDIGNGERFNVTGRNVPLFEAPPMDYGTQPKGLRVLWGREKNAVEYPQGFMPRYHTFSVPPQGEQCRWYLLGTGSHELTDELIATYKERMDSLKQRSANIISARPYDPHLPAMNHLATQIKFNRRYPSLHEPMAVPSFTACPSMDIDYHWDAGYSAMGLATVDGDLAKQCIKQYLPGSADTVWPMIIGALVPTQILAAWDLFQYSGDKDSLREVLPGLHHLLLYCSGEEDLPGAGDMGDATNLDPQNDGIICPPGGGTGLDDCPSQVWTRGYGMDWARQENYWAEPIEVNPTGKYLPTKSVNATAFVILSCKLLKLMREALALPAEPLYDRIIERSENALIKDCWNDTTRHFHWVIAETHEQLPVWDLSGLTPLFSSTWKDREQRDQMLDNLIDIYLTDDGLSTSNPQTEFDRAAYYCGAIWLPLQWNFFKALLGIGRLDHARKLANGVVGLYRRNHDKLPACYEKFDDATRLGCGDLWFGALASPLVSLWSAYYQPGACTLSYLTMPQSIEVSDNLTTAKLAVRCDDPNPQPGGLIVLKPGAKYRLTHNNKISHAVSDEWGCIEFLLEGQGAENSLLFDRVAD